jgi:CHASE2 domain-containing sensor protein/tRNA A-37 threonylcarbamoyl transferase component Bud32
MIKKFSGLILYLLITIFVVTIYLDQPAILNTWEMSLYDKLFQLRGKHDVSDDIQIIAIDDVSTKSKGEWPWNRDILANLVTKIGEQNPRAIFIDLPLTDDPRQDSLGYTKKLAEAIKQAGSVILPYRFSAAEYSNAGFILPEYIRKNGYTRFDNIADFENKPPLSASSIFPPTPQLAEAAAALGFAGVSFDPDRYIRTSPMILGYAGNYMPSVPLVIARTYMQIDPRNVDVAIGKDIRLGSRVIPINALGKLEINYNGPSHTFKYVSALDILNDTVGKKDLSGRIAIIAYTGAGAVDIYSTPVSKAMYGAEITANSVENIIHNHFLKDYGSANLINLLIIVAIGIFSAFILPRISLMFRFIVLGISLIVIANVSFVLFTNFDIVTKMFYPMIMILFFILTAPMMKLTKISEAEEEEEIDYDTMLAGTPFRGIQSSSHINVGTGHTPPMGIQGTAHSQGQAEIATMQITANKTKAPLPATNFGRYRVLEPIGQGAMGMVYRGLDPAIDRPVALKTIRLDSIVNQNEMFELKERLTREAKAAGNLSHPNIVTIYDVGEEQTIQYIAMEYLDGQTLEALLSTDFQWDYKTLCKIMIQVCEALDFAHERGIVHRDIKPANIMMVAGERVKVMDFGIARFDQSNMTQSGVALGTPNYISPEQLKGMEVDRRSDIFSLGVVFYELLTHTKPFKGDTISALIYSILHTNPPAPSELNLDVPRIFDKIVAKALAKDPDLRFQTAREMADILRKLI